MKNSSKKTGRNNPCPCGSGKKYKKCCLQKIAQKNIRYDTSILDKEIHDAARLFLEHNEKSIIDSIEKLRNLLNRSNLNHTQKLNIQLNLAKAYQKRGEHYAAIETLNSIENEMHSKQGRIMGIFIKHLEAISYCALGFHEKSCDLFNEALNELDKQDSNPRMKAFVCAEAGKAFMSKGDKDKARGYLIRALNYFEGKEDDIENYARVKANLGVLLLDDPDETNQEEGVKIVEESSDLKKRIGDLEGLANNYCNLGDYYWKKKRYERAIAFTRMDLQLSRKVGDKRAIASTLGNLAVLYAELKQLSPARHLLNEAMQIGEALNDEHLIEITNRQLELVDDIGRSAGKTGEKTGPVANCGCGSGKEYQDCCGRADFEPIDIPVQFGGISEDLEQIVKSREDAGEEYSQLDFILRQTAQSKTRQAWSKIEVHDGWLKMSELPDMANHHLISARLLANEAKSEPDSITKPLSCVILCACALEAFINQIAFFLHEIQDFPEHKLHIIPPELTCDAMVFQQHTELTLKWDILGKALCCDYWQPSDSLLTDFKGLIYIRNELVHFKAAEYEQVVPPAKSPHDIIRCVPQSVEIRKIPHSWPARLLTPSFASWCVNVTESMIDYFKLSYYKSRLNRVHPKVRD